MQIIDLFVHNIWILFHNIHANYRFICAWQYEICIGVIFIIIEFYSTLKDYFTENYQYMKCLFIVYLASNLKSNKFVCISHL